MATSKSNKFSRKPKTINLKAWCELQKLLSTPPTQCRLPVQLKMESYELFKNFPFIWPLQHSPLMPELQSIVLSEIQSNSAVSCCLFPLFFQPFAPTFQDNNHLIFHILVSKGMVQVLKPHLQGLFYCLQLFNRLLTNVVNSRIGFQGIALKCS